MQAKSCSLTHCDSLTWSLQTLFHCLLDFFHIQFESSAKNVPCTFFCGIWNWLLPEPGNWIQWAMAVIQCDNFPSTLFQPWDKSFPVLPSMTTQNIPPFLLLPFGCLWTWILSLVCSFSSAVDIYIAVSASLKKHTKSVCRGKKPTKKTLVPITQYLEVQRNVICWKAWRISMYPYLWNTNLKMEELELKKKALQTCIVFFRYAILSL